MRPPRVFGTLLSLFLPVVILPPTVAAASSTYNVTINTSSLVGHQAGPFTLLFAMTDGSGLSDGNNTAAVSSANFSDGNALGDPTAFGGVSGDLGSVVVMTDTQTLGFFSESFNAGQSLSFTVTLTNNVDDGPIPDGFTVYILDNSGIPIPTLSPGADYFIGLTLGVNGSTPLVFGSDVSRPPSVGSPVSIPPPTVQGYPVITWPTPAAITYGTALSATQLDATASVAGSFTYVPPSGTVLNAGAQTLTVSFSPTDTTDYATVTQTVTLQVNQATPTITWATPAPIPYGTPLSAVQLNATANVPGTFAYSPAAGTVLTAGPQTLSMTFTPTGTTDYTTATDSVTLTVNQATQTITFAPITAQLVGATIPLNASATSGMAVAFQSLTPTVCAVSQTTATALSLGTCTIEATQSGSVDYNPANPVQISFPVMGFTLTAEPASETIKRGVLGVFLLEVKSVNGFAGNVSIDCTGGPPQSVCRDFPQTARVKANGTALALSGILFRPQDVAGTYTITFTGTSGTDTSAATAQFTVK